MFNLNVYCTSTFIGRVCINLCILRFSPSSLYIRGKYRCINFINDGNVSERFRSSGMTNHDRNIFSTTYFIDHKPLFFYFWSFNFLPFSMIVYFTLSHFEKLLRFGTSMSNIFDIICLMYVSIRTYMYTCGLRKRESHGSSCVTTHIEMLLTYL